MKIQQTAGKIKEKEEENPYLKIISEKFIRKSHNLKRNYANIKQENEQKICDVKTFLKRILRNTYTASHL